MSLGIASIWRIALQKAIITHNIHVSSYFSMRCHVLHRVSQEEKAFSGLTLASVHKDLRLCDLCKELAFGTQRADRKNGSSYNSFAFSMLCRQFLESPNKSLLSAPADEGITGFDFPGRG